MPDLGFDQWLPQIVSSYVQGRLGILQGSDEAAAQEVGDQLDNLEVISDEFESLPVRVLSGLVEFRVRVCGVCMYGVRLPFLLVGMSLLSSLALSHTQCTRASG